MKRKTLLSWSSGKDSAWALHVLQQDPAIELSGLFTTVNKEFNRVAMHGVRVELLKRQAKHAGLPLHIIEIPYPCSNEEYESQMRQFVESALQDDIECFAFGDLFLEDVRQYRVDNLQGSGIDPIFPIWETPTDQLAQTMISSGVRAVITCVDSSQISGEFAGREFDQRLLDEMPLTADPCGENGEFHSFVYAGPMFNEKIGIEVGDIVDRDGFVFADVLPVAG